MHTYSGSHKSHHHKQKEKNADCRLSQTDWELTKYRAWARAVQGGRAEQSPHVAEPMDWAARGFLFVCLFLFRCLFSPQGDYKHVIHVLSYIQRQSLMLLLLMLSNNVILFISLWFYHSATYSVHIPTEVKLRIWAAVSSDNGNNCFLQSVYNLQFSHRAHTRTHNHATGPAKH